jgi:hypothetical protein
MLSYYDTLCRLADEENRAEAYLMEAWHMTLNKYRDGFFDMVLRECFCSPLAAVGPDAFHNDMHYKCAKSYGCDQVKTFGVPIDKECHNALMIRRKGQARIQPREDWDKDEDIKQQLKDMGYI